MNKTEVSKVLLSRFVKYAKIDSMSCEKAADEGIRPSTAIQKDMLMQVQKDLKSIGVDDISDGGFYVIGRIKSNVAGAPAVGLMAHVDTASDVEGNGVKPLVHENYDGSDLVLKNDVVITVKDNKDLLNYKGGTIITSDGTTLLGADDKAGVAEIMAAAEQLMVHPEMKHGEVELIFTTDEETGHGLDNFPYEKLHCTTCYTLDGGAQNIIETECFNASHAQVKFVGKSYHFGAARGRMISAIDMASKFLNLVPAGERPETTMEREGYYGAVEIKGGVASAQLDFILRDFDLDGLERREKFLTNLAATVEEAHPGSSVDVTITRQYYNMAEVSKKHPEAVDNIIAACKKLNQPAHFELIRGGTDGARMANEADIPCPNLYTGGYNYHSLYEWCALSPMAEVVELVLAILEVGTQKA